MVDEFSSFARMPSAVLETQDLGSVVKEATVLQRVSSSDVDIDVETGDDSIDVPVRPPPGHPGRHQSGQECPRGDRGAPEHEEPNRKGACSSRPASTSDTPFIRVTDNGIGLPKENRNRLTEPYMTTREKGTGLGLAIVKRIMEEHRGRLVLEDCAADFAAGSVRAITLYFEPIPANATRCNRLRSE